MEKLPTEITENGIHYTIHGDYYFPDLIVPDDHRPIGKWGRMHQAHLMEQKPGLYSHLILPGRLYCYLADLNDQAQTRLEVIIRQYADITELDAVTLNKLVRQIVVHEEIGEDGVRRIAVEIHFNMRQPG